MFPICFEGAELGTTWLYSGVHRNLCEFDYLVQPSTYPCPFPSPALSLLDTHVRRRLKRGIVWDRKCVRLGLCIGSHVSLYAFPPPGMVVNSILAHSRSFKQQSKTFCLAYPATAHDQHACKHNRLTNPLNHLASFAWCHNRVDR